MFIQNVPAYAHNYDFWVVRRFDGQYWFYGAWDDRHTANEVALEVGGATFERKAVEGK